MMMIIAGRQAHRAATVTLGHLKPERIPIKPQRPVQVRNGKVNMTNANFRMK
jgi:hypothetical protein